MENYGVFICHRHKDWGLAGRIYGFLNAKGVKPFMSTETMHQGRFPDHIKNAIQGAPYFLLVLTENTFPCEGKDDWIYQEVKLALETEGCEILCLSKEMNNFPIDLPEDIKELAEHQIDRMPQERFNEGMDLFFNKNISWDVLVKRLGWRQRLSANRNLFMTQRQALEERYASKKDRFGYELVEQIERGCEFSGESSIKAISMSCYAASIVLAPDQEMVDERAYDRNVMANVFAQLLKDPEFVLEIIITAPDCAVAKEAVKNKRLGNRAVEDIPELVFYSAYHNLWELVETNPVFTEAYKRNRFRFMVTDKFMPYALFFVEHRAGYEENDCVKVDLYSGGLISNMDRRSMFVFRQDDYENYAFFKEQYKFYRDTDASKALIRKNHQKWMDKWCELEKKRKGNK